MQQKFLLFIHGRREAKYPNLHLAESKIKTLQAKGGRREYGRHRTKFEALGRAVALSQWPSWDINICRFVSTSGTAVNTLAEGNNKDMHSFERHAVHHLPWESLVSVEKDRYFNCLLEQDILFCDRVQFRPCEIIVS